MVPVSVIIPTHNRLPSLLRAVDSVLAQTRPTVRIFLIDDGGSDPTPEHFRAHPRIRFIRLDRNHGVSFARNVGIREACLAPGWIAFLDSDDTWHPAKLERQTKWLEQNPLFSVCQTEDIWMRRGIRVNPEKKHRKPEGWIFEKCVSLCCITPSSVMLHSSVFENIGAFDESLPVCEDYDLWLRLSLRYQVGLVKERLITRYQGGDDQLSTTTPLMDTYRIRALRKLLLQHPLTAGQKACVLKALRKLCRIVLNGAEKRGKRERAEYYRAILESLER